MTRRPVTLIVLAALGVALLTGLGVWQLQRLHWKEALIAERTARLKSPPKPLHEVLALARQGDDIDYMTVRLEGTFAPTALQFFSTRGGPAAWEIVSPFTTVEGVYVLVDRGVMPDGQTALPPPPEGVVTIEGLARMQGPPGAFTPDNAPDRNQWYWWDLPAMAKAAGAPAGTEPALVVDLAWPAPSGLEPLKPIVAVSNRHLGYALTWFGLAATLIGVTTAYLLSGRRSPAA
jgi:surfeit locus 1 family protein